MTEDAIRLLTYLHPARRETHHLVGVHSVQDAQIQMTKREKILVFLTMRSVFLALHPTLLVDKRIVALRPVARLTRPRNLANGARRGGGDWLGSIWMFSLRPLKVNETRP